MKYQSFVCVFTSILAFAPPSTAQQSNLGWTGIVGLGVQNGPTFPGSDKSESTGLPLVDLTWNDTIFVNSERGVGFLVRSEDRDGGPLTLGLGIGYDFDERTSNDDVRLSGLVEVSSSATALAFAEYDVGLVDIEVQISRGLSSDGHEGTRVETGLEANLPLGHRTILSAGPFIVWADAQYSQAFFGVTPAGAVASGLPTYSAGSGFVEAGVEVGVFHQLTDRLGIFGQIEYSNLLGDAKASPVSFDDSAFELSAGIALRF